MSEQEAWEAIRTIALYGFCGSITLIAVFRRIIQVIRERSDELILIDPDEDEYEDTYQPPPLYTQRRAQIPMWDDSIQSAYNEVFGTAEDGDDA